MQTLLMFLMLGVNFWISWSNARCVGKYWSESKEVGGSFRRLVVCGYVMAVAGFTMVYGYLLLIVAPYIFQAMGYSHSFVTQLQSLSADLIYLLVGASVILSGFRITAHSLRGAWEQKSFSYIANAGWNSYAQIHNVVNYARSAPSAFGRIVKALFGGSGKKSRSKDENSAYIAFLAILIVVLALLGGYFTADAIMKRADAEYDAFDVAVRAREAEGSA